MTLGEVREGIDKADAQIKELFRERMALADQVAQVKAQSKDTIFKPEREAAIIEKQSADMDPSVRAEYISFLRRIMQLSREYQYGRMLELRPGCMDIPFSDEEPALLTVAVEKEKMSGNENFSFLTIRETGSLNETAELAESGTVSAGIGFFEEPGSASSWELCCLLAEKELFINRFRLVKESEEEKKAVLFSGTLAARPEDDHLAVLFSCPDPCGSLANVLSVIADHKVAVSEFAACADKKAGQGYLFYAELEVNFRQKETQAMLFQLMSETQAFWILGSYQKET